MAGAVAAANRYVLDVAKAVPSRRGMGTTLSGLVLLQDQAYTVQVGDSRVYRLRAGELAMLTQDHTYIEESMRQGTMTAEEAENHPYRHVLTRAVGTEDTVVPDIESHDLKPGDTYLLCSDGLLNHVPDDQIAAVMRNHSPSEACWKLVAMALLGGGSDNTTVMVVRVDGLDAFDEAD
jgi:protein phosphatase